jgi:hypothetical protein
MKGDDRSDTDTIRYAGTMALQSTAWSASETDGMLASDQDVRYFHFGVEVKASNRITKASVNMYKWADPALGEKSFPKAPQCSFTTPINEPSDYRKAIGMLATLFMRQRYTALADVTPCLIRPTMDFREEASKEGKSSAQKVICV